MKSAYSGLIGRRLRSFGMNPPEPGPPENRETKMLSGPSSLKYTTIPCRRPVSSDATVTTVVIPMTMPRIVSSERKRCVQTWRIARFMFSVGLMYMVLVRPQRHHGIEPRRPRCRIPAGSDSYNAGHANRQNDVPERDVQRQADHLAD